MNTSATGLRNQPRFGASLDDSAERGPSSLCPATARSRSVESTLNEGEGFEHPRGFWIPDEVAEVPLR